MTPALEKSILEAAQSIAEKALRTGVALGRQEAAKEIERLREALTDAATRMERARSILSKDGNWAMLDTATIRTALAAAEAQK